MDAWYEAARNKAKAAGASLLLSGPPVESCVEIKAFRRFSLLLIVKSASR